MAYFRMVNIDHFRRSYEGEKMILGIKFELNNELYVKYDLSDYVKIENKIANVHLPEYAKPIPLGNILKILYAEFNPQLIYEGNVSGTLEGWNYLETLRIPLGKVAVTLAKGEITKILTEKFQPAIPLIVSPLK